MGRTPDFDIFSGLPFKESTGNMTDVEKEAEFKKYISALDEKGKAEAYVKMMSIPSKEQIDAAVGQNIQSATRDNIVETLLSAFSQQMNMSTDEINEYISTMSDEELKEIFTEMATEQYKAQYAASVKQQMAALSNAQLALMLDNALTTFTTEQNALYHDEVLEFSESSYDANMRELGYIDIESPATINIYASSFENKDVIEGAITDYNNNVDELEKITYTDYVGLMMSSITTIINAITYVLIAFVAVSLVVSSIMIGVITLISVQERTKEIGILRAIGASKKNVSSMFNAETVIIGFSAGTLGVIITYLICIPVNIILHRLTGIGNLSTHLPVPVAIILVIISVILTMFAGIIPSRSAAKKDPVVALRTE